ncbi:hypothetical protein F4679DRAFT_571182 [Xylaria curta]|nr:hypothetical protein F4679DRAFT_571182 [Xylaria curta]
MPKWDKTRDYYADLELQTSATPDEIKRQFKKLALKYHPDRNPGREAEVNPKFQVIQSAHEILTDETLRRQYDEARRTYTSRYPGASGVRGNPWQDAAKAYPPPPRRQPNTPNRSNRPTSGAQRYERFADGIPRHTRPQSPKDDPQFRRNNADAWEHIRPNRGRGNAASRPTTPGRAPPGRAPTSATRDSRPGPAPVPPRTAYQKQKAEAAFGTSKKTGFTPRSPGVADEPPVTNKNYFTNRTHSNLFTEPVDIPQPPFEDTTDTTPADPIPPLRDQFFDRQRTPYHTGRGEKFDSSPGLGRSTSTRMPPRGYEMPGAFPHTRPRSTSPTRSSSNDGGSEDSIKANTGTNGAANRNNQTTYSRAGERYKPTMPAATESPPQPTSHGKLHRSQLTGLASLTEKLTESSSNSTAAQPNSSRPSVYGSQTLSAQFRCKTNTTTSQPDQSREHADRNGVCLSRIKGYHLPNPSSEEIGPHDPNALLPLEMYQRKTLDRLVRNHSIASESRVGKSQHTSHDLTSNSKVDADYNRASSFNFSSGPSTARTDAGFKTFTRNSAENINTRFVDLEDDWQFKAGSASANEATIPPRSRPQSRNRPPNRQKTFPKPPFSTPMPEAQDTPVMSSGDQGFSAGMWNEQIGSQHFEPQPSNSASTSPTRRGPPKKSKSFKMTAGTAAVVDEEESEEYQDTHRPSMGPTSMVPDAMDIDTPPVEKTEGNPNPIDVNSARKYATEPYRKDWRAGDVNGVSSSAGRPAPSTNGTNGAISQTNGIKPEVGTTNNGPLRHGGSEDSEEFRATFSDFKNVEPFADPSPSGLKSFAALKSTLPFESRPSEQIPSDIKPPPVPARPLEFPHPPVAPRLPPTMGVAGLRPNNSSFKKYAESFHNYMEKWDVFNNKVLAHFVTRQEEFKSRRLRRGANWLEEGVTDYLTEVDQDLDVQKKYADACAEHRKSVAQFREFRDRVW